MRLLSHSICLSFILYLFSKPQGEVLSRLACNFFEQFLYEYTQDDVAHNASALN